MGDLFEEPKTTIKALSLWQPWASLVARGVKRHETRGWSTPYRGPIAIHAAKTLDRAGAPERLCLSALGPDWSRDCPLGAIVAVADLTDCLAAASVAEAVTRADYAAGNFAPGRFAWRLDNVRSLARPIPLTGRQGLFNWSPPADLEDNLGPILDHEAICHRIGWGRSGLREAAA